MTHEGNTPFMEAPRALSWVRVRGGAGWGRGRERGASSAVPLQLSVLEAKQGGGEGGGKKGEEGEEEEGRSWAPAEPSLSVGSWVSNCAQPLTLYVTSSGKSLIPLSLFRYLFSWDRQL